MRSPITLFFLTLYLGLFLIQSQMILHQDVISFAHAAESLLMGGTYSKSFFETNPPLIIYLSLPIALIKQYFHTNLIPTITAYITLLISASLLLSYHLTKDIFDKQDQRLRAIFVSLLGITLFILPMNYFGQREHLLLAFTIPYVLLLTLRIEHKNVNTGKACLVGTISGVGFLFKPFFLIIPCFLSLYAAYRSRRLQTLFSPENICILLLGLLYTGVAIYLHPDYFQSVMPFMLNYYYQGLADPLIFLIFTPPLMLVWVTLGYYAIFLPRYRYKTLNTTLAITLVSVYFAYLLNHTAWVYHMLPSYLLSILLFLFLITQELQTPPTDKQVYTYQACIALLLVSALSFIVKFYWHRSAWLLPIFGVQIIALYSVIYFLYLNNTSKKWQRRLHHLPTALLASLFITTPIMLTSDFYRVGHFYKKQATAMSKHLQALSPGEKIYHLSTTSRFISPASEMVNINNITRFPVLWMLPGILKAEKNHPERAQRDLNTVINMVSNDIAEYKPKLILVDVSQQQEALPETGFNYTAIFSKNREFKKVLDNYQPIAEWSFPILSMNKRLITYQIYERVAS